MGNGPGQYQNGGYHVWPLLFGSAVDPAAKALGCALARGFVNASVVFGDVSEWVDGTGKPSGAGGYVSSAANALQAIRQMQRGGGCAY